MKALDNRFYVKFMQLEIGLLKSLFAVAKRIAIQAYLRYFCQSKIIQIVQLSNNIKTSFI